MFSPVYVAKPPQSCYLLSLPSAHLHFCHFCAGQPGYCTCIDLYFWVKVIFTFIAGVSPEFVFKIWRKSPRAFPILQRSPRIFLRLHLTRPLAFCVCPLLLRQKVIEKAKMLSANDRRNLWRAQRECQTAGRVAANRPTGCCWSSML